MTHGQERRSGEHVAHYRDRQVPAIPHLGEAAAVPPELLLSRQWREPTLSHGRKAT